MSNKASLAELKTTVNLLEALKLNILLDYEQELERLATPKPGKGRK